MVLVGPTMDLTQHDGEDPIAYTLRIVAETLDKANEPQSASAWPSAV